MGSTSTASNQRLTRKSSSSSSPKSSRRLHKPHQQHCHRSGGSSSSSVSDKLEALKNLIPTDGAGMKPDDLFQETADYIVLLKTQVLVLQKLIDFYGSQPHEKPNAV